MYDVRVIVNVVEHLHRCLGEECKPLCIIIISVQIVAFKIVLIIQEVIYYTLMTHFKDTAILIPPSQRNIEIADELHLLPELLGDVFIQRNDNPALVAGITQSLRQRARYICQSTRCDKRSCLTCNKQNFHRFERSSLYQSRFMNLS